MIQSFEEAMPLSIQDELLKRSREINHIQELSQQIGASIPKFQNQLLKFVANPSTISTETFKRMIDTDDQIGAANDQIISALVGRIGEYHHPSTELQEFVRKALEMMEGSWTSNLADMFTAEWAGFSVTEKMWKFDPDFYGVPAYLPRCLKTYPPLTIVFATDECGNVLPDGIYQYQQYWNGVNNGMGVLGFIGGPSGQGGAINGFRPDLYASRGDLPFPVYIGSDLTFMSVQIPYNKCIHLTSTSSGTFNNPYGRSNLRRVYKHWIAKDAFLKMKIITADRKGSPMIIAYCDPHKTVLDTASEMQMDSAYLERFAKSTTQALENELRNYHNNSYILLPGKKGETYEVESIAIQGDLSIFKQAIDDCNSAITKGLLVPELSMGSGDGVGSYALGSEHSSTFYAIIDFKLKAYRQKILDQFIQQILAFNFPRKLWEKDGVGTFHHEEQDVDQLSKYMDVFDKAAQFGALNMQFQPDFDLVRTKLGAVQTKVFSSAYAGPAPDLESIFKEDPPDDDEGEKPKS